MKKLFLLFFLIPVLFLYGCKENPGKKERTSNTAFLIGGDISVLQKIEDYGGIYTVNGKQQKPLKIFKDNGFNAVRLRLFHTPNGEGPVCNDLDYTLKLAKRVKEEGFQLLLNFHYSDTWADPQHQLKPAAWQDLSFDELENTMYTYTREVIKQFYDQNCLPEIVQVGNEITPGFLWDDGKVSGEFNTPEQWNQLGRLVKAGIRGVHEGAGEDKKIRIMIHIDRGGDKDGAEWFLDNIMKQGVEFNIIGLSYYPWWHGTFEDLKHTLEFVAWKYEQDIILVEASYPWTGSMPQGATGHLEPLFPITPEGQADYFSALIQIVLNTPENKAKGIYYWAPEWIPVEQVGRGWKNNTMFSYDGEALPVFNVFNEISKKLNK